MQPHTFTTTFKKLERVLINQAKVAQALNSSSVDVNQHLKTCKRYRVIWDTGATNCVITKKVVAECGLQPTGVKKVYTGNDVNDEPRLSNSYFVLLFLPNNVYFNPVEVTEGTIVGADLLIGMDIIRTGDFVVTNHNGKTVFSFRWPSQGCIDFVKEPSISTL